MNKVNYLGAIPIAIGTRGIRRKRTFNFEASLGVLNPLAVPIKYITIVLVCVPMFLIGQRKANGERIKALKIAFITERLALTSDEATEFWPIYNEHETQIEALRRTEMTEIRTKLRNPESISDAEASDLLDQYIELEDKRLRLRKEFIKELEGVIPARKIIQLVRTEEDFKKRMLKQIRQRRPHNER